MVKIEEKKETGYLLITLIGEIDASNSLELDQTIARALKSGEQHIVVDGSRLEYISSAGLGVFMSYIEDMKAQNVKFVLFGLSDKVYSVFRILGLDELLMIKADKSEALEV
ncbi:STAS domain-containing protein [Penaeicola halotolerans]|uniref:STAS domain-containing protein n=1 Tax=Penaeicola halotolerans TaxID=2793196 RepID=UPI001CF8A644|nr:STAS domain-containing protein [Penaeicola halotolerans]